MSAPKPKPASSKFSVPTFLIPTVKIPQADGAVLVRAGKPIEVGDELGITAAAKILGLSYRRVQFLCQSGNFKTANKPGGTTRSNWRIARSEVLERKGQVWE